MLQQTSRFRQIRFFWFAISWFQSARNSSYLKIRASFFCYEHQSLRIHSKQNKVFKSLQQALKVQAGRFFTTKGRLRPKVRTRKRPPDFHRSGLGRKKNSNLSFLSIFSSHAASVSVWRKGGCTPRKFLTQSWRRNSFPWKAWFTVSRFGDKVAFFDIDLTTNNNSRLI